MPRPSRPKNTSPTLGTGGRPPTQAPMAATGQPYGAAGAQLKAQAAVPLPGNTPGTAPAAPPAGRPDFASVLAAASGFASETGGLRGPSTRPDEPVTAGLSLGPGVGPDPGMERSGDDPTLAELRAIYSLYPNPDLLELIEMAESGATF